MTLASFFSLHIPLERSTSRGSHRDASAFLTVTAPKRIVSVNFVRPVSGLGANRSSRTRMILRSSASIHATPWRKIKMFLPWTLISAGNFTLPGICANAATKASCLSTSCFPRYRNRDSSCSASRKRNQIDANPSPTTERAPRSETGEPCLSVLYFYSLRVAPREMDFFTGKVGEPVPVVDAADIKAMWTYSQELKSQHGGLGVGVDVDIWKQVCQPGADIRAVCHRLTMLWLLEMMLRAAWTGGELSENAFKVAAKIDSTGCRSVSFRMAYLLI
jgi:hypothetical protein